MRLIALLAVALPAFAAPVPKELRQRPSLIGMWRITATEGRGVKHTPTQGQRWEFGETSLKIHPDTVPNNPAFVQTCQGTYKLDVDNRTGWFDFFDTGSNSNSLGLYECDGGTLRIGFVFNARGRPVDLKPGTDKVIYTFDRVKE